MAEWKKFILEDVAQRFERQNADNGFVLKYIDGSESKVLYSINKTLAQDATDYLICEPQEPHPHDEMRTRWELTGQPVWGRNAETRNGIWLLFVPTWAEHWEYSLTEPKPEKVMETEYFIVDETGRVINRGWMKNDSAITHANNCHIVTGISREVKA